MKSTHRSGVIVSPISVPPNQVLARPLDIDMGHLLNCKSYLEYMNYLASGLSATVQANNNNNNNNIPNENIEDDTNEWL